MREQLAWIPFVLIYVFGSWSPALAEMCTLDVVPAATLLVPYFEAEIGDANGNEIPDCAEGQGVDTVFSINNAWAEPALTHVTMWTDWSFPTIDFDIYLTGYDVQNVSLCQAIGLGRLPVTADAPRDPDDEISPHAGKFSDNPAWDDTDPSTPPSGSHPGHDDSLEGYSECKFVFPFPDPVVTAGLLERFQDGHSGYPVASLQNDCAGEGLNGDGGEGCTNGICPPGTIARGYVTIDRVNNCSLLFPFDEGYFENITTTDNQLWGDVVYVDYDNGTTATSSLVHIEADPEFDTSSTPTEYTFYGRYTQSLGGIDHREPLGTVWSARYRNGEDNSESDFVVWRDSTFGDTNGFAGYECGTGPSVGPVWRPLQETHVTCFDEQESALTLCDGASDPACLPLETQRVRAGDGNLALPFEAGWCYLNLNIPGDDFPGDVDFPPDPPGDVAQSYVLSLHRGSLGDAAFASAAPGLRVAGACQDLSPVIEVEGPVFADNFETGDLAAW